VRRLGLVAAFAAALLFPASALAHFGPRDWVLGYGEIATADTTQPANKFLIAAVSGPNGEQPKGVAGYWVTLVDDGLTFFAGPPECINVVGNSASLVIDLTHTRNNPPRFEDGGAVIQVVDKGLTKWGKPPVDLQHNNRLTPDELNSMRNADGKIVCPAPDAPVGGIIKGPLKLIAKGDIFVHDAVVL
jgi:hypothetical protein